MNDKITTYSFCTPFIPRLRKDLQRWYIDQGQDLSRLALVFGGKRPALFLKRDLAQSLGHGFAAPRIFSVDEFIQYTARKKESFGMAQDMNQAYLLYQMTKKYAPEILKRRESFAQFLPWAKELAGFIDQLDLETVDSDRLRHIQANAHIGYPVPDDINQLLESIIRIREAYHNALKADRVYSRGMQYLRAAEIVEDVSFEEFDDVLFCNFFYYNKAEEKVIKSLYERGQARLIFQGDQRKWPVLDRIARTMNCSLTEGKEPDPTTFQLKVYAGFDAHAQAGLIREILAKIPEQDKVKTVIVLPEPDQIIPVMSEIAPHLTDFNISMGYPLKRSSLYTLCSLIMHAQNSRGDSGYYTKDYLKVLRHPFIKNLRLHTDPAVTRILVHKLEEILTGIEATDISGSLFLDLDDVLKTDELFTLTQDMADRLKNETDKESLVRLLKEIHRLFFHSWEDVRCFRDFAERMQEVLDVLMDKGLMQHYPLNSNIADKMLSILDEFRQADFNEEPLAQEELFRIFDNKVSGEIIAFKGSPLKGLQILGLFETRSLNFDHVIVLDMNEGCLPKLSIYEPLIPREVMISLNLDRLELEEEIQRYQFMRLISSAKHVHLVYQESKEKERSRFIEELIWEEQKKQCGGGQTALDEAVPVIRASFDVQSVPYSTAVKKTPAMIAALKAHTFSASSINTYLRNPMDFYQNYVLGIREQEDLLDEPEARHIGTFIHELLEEAFQPFVNKVPVIDAAFRKHFKDLFERRFVGAFGRSMRSDGFLLRSVIVERLNRFLDVEQYERQQEIDQLLHLETRFTDTLPLAGEQVKFIYVVDRVERLKDGTVMIIDYKTGMQDVLPKAIAKIGSMELSREAIRDVVKSFQIPLYYFYLNKAYPDRPINAALYNLRTVSLQRFIDAKMKSSRKEIEAAFMRALDFIMQEIFDPNVDFDVDEKFA